MRARIFLTHNGNSFEGEVDLMPVRSSKKERRSKPAAEEPTIPAKPSEVLRQMFEKGFFKGPRSLTDVSQEFAKKEYNFGKSSLMMALQRAKFIQQRGAKGSYTFVQKFPPSALTGK